MPNSFGGFHVLAIAALIINYIEWLIFSHLIGTLQDVGFFWPSFPRKLRFFYDYAVNLCVYSQCFCVSICDSFPTDSRFCWLVFNGFDREMCFKNANCFQEKVGY